MEFTELIDIFLDEVFSIKGEFRKLFKKANNRTKEYYVQEIFSNLDDLECLKIEREKDYNSSSKLDQLAYSYERIKKICKEYNDNVSLIRIDRAKIKGVNSEEETKIEEEMKKNAYKLTQKIITSFCKLFGETTLKNEIKKRLIHQLGETRQ